MNNDSNLFDKVPKSKKYLLPAVFILLLALTAIVVSKAINKTRPSFNALDPAALERVVKSIGLAVSNSEVTWVNAGSASCHEGECTAANQSKSSDPDIGLYGWRILALASAMETSPSNDCKMGTRPIKRQIGN